VNIIIENCQEKHELSKNIIDVINRTVYECFLSEGFNENCEIGINIVDNERIRELNKQYMDKDKHTDVLSFPLLDIKEGVFDLRQEDMDGDEHTIIIGDIVISMEKAVEQAFEYGHSLEREIAFLVSHGTYHLLGYDHGESENELKMIELQEKVLDRMGMTR
jgi:probable rRNA maturation factor